MDAKTNVPEEGGPFRLDCGGDLSLVRRDLEAAGYTESAISLLLSRDQAGRTPELPGLLRRTAAVTPLNTLARLFMLASSVPEADLRAALPPATVESLFATGLVERHAEGIRAVGALMPIDDLLIVRELWPEFAGAPVSRSHVLGVGRTSRTVAYLTVRRGGELALDLGTGSGFLALLVGRHARRVIGTDINPRALNFAALNARLNGVSNLELRQGSLFEPVADCRFDLIVANPPFVISPQSEYEFRDSGLPGDALSERVIRGAAEMLTEGGYCTVLFNWHHRTLDDWADRPTRWLEQPGCDAWLTCFLATDPIGYASQWLREDPGHRDAQEQARRLDEWLAYLDKLGIGMISLGAVILRRRSGGKNWIRADSAPAGEPTQSCSAQIERIFAAQDFLEELRSGGSMLDRAFLLTPDHELQHTLHLKDGNWAVEAGQLKQTTGYPFVGNVDRLVATLLAGCDGRRTLRTLVADLATGLHVDAAHVGPACCNVIEMLLRWGFLTAAPRA